MPSSQRLGTYVNKSGLTDSLQGKKELPRGRAERDISIRCGAWGFCLDWSKSKDNSRIFWIFIWKQEEHSRKEERLALLWFGKCSCFVCQTGPQSSLVLVLLHHSHRVKGLWCSVKHLCSPGEPHDPAVRVRPAQPTAVRGCFFSSQDSHYIWLLRLIFLF